VFSIVIPLYNKELFIKRCIDSVLAQTYLDYELIVVDDGSTDNGLSIVRSYKDSKMKILTQTNSGAGAARNRGVIESSKTWIAFLDADDSWTNDHLEELKTLTKMFEDVGLVSTKSTEIKAGQMPAITIRKENTERKIVDYFRYAAVRSGFIHTSSVAVKREVFEKLGYFKSFHQGEDTEFFSRVCLVYSCAVSNKATSYYFRGTGGIMEYLWDKKKKKMK
jgi:glycosyltransferase involved in cell wall biosynthesis